MTNQQEEVQDHNRPRGKIPNITRSCIGSLRVNNIEEKIATFQSGIILLCLNHARCMIFPPPSISSLTHRLPRKLQSKVWVAKSAQKWEFPLFRHSSFAQTMSLSRGLGVARRVIQIEVPHRSLFTFFHNHQQKKEAASNINSILLNF